MTIRVVRDQRRPMRHEIQIGETTLTTDISVEEGGEASGPNPMTSTMQRSARAWR
jgi:hypothetical protein